MNHVSRWVAAVRALLFVVCSAVLLAVAARWERMAYSQLAVGCSTAIATLLLTMLFVRWEGLRLGDAGARFTRGSLTRFGVAFIAGLALPFLRAGLGVLTTGLRYEWTGSFQATGAALALATFVALACREELAFRGYPLRRLEGGFGAWGAQLMIAALFAAEHVAGGWTWKQAILGAGVGSIFFGAAALRTRGLAMPIGLHAAWNFGDWMLGGKETQGLWRPIVEPGGMAHVQVIQMATYIALMIAATLAIWFWPRGATETAVS